jgi:hypothetical protein
MQKPDTTEKIIDQLWVMFVGYDEDGIYFVIKDVQKKISEFITNNENLRGVTCPYKTIVEKFNGHLDDHEKGKDFRLKRWQVIIAACAFLAMVVFNIYSTIKP